MSGARRIEFEHDGHRFSVVEERLDGAETQLRWTVHLDDASTPVLEFRGEYPYRDDDVRRRVVEWYGIQKPTA